MSRRRQLLTLAAACVGQFMILLDITIVSVALPSIQRELDASPGNLLWVVNAYALSLASLILVGGTLGDRYGRKRFFLVGFVIFAALSAACALATGDSELIAFRAVQGVGAALLAPLALSILVNAFPPEQRAWAIGIWATIAGLGFTAGPVVGGVLVEVFDWSAIFWVNVPIGLLGIVLTLAFVRESRDPGARRLDLGGAALVSAGLFSLTFALVESDDHAWTSAFTLGFLGGAVVLLAAFLLYELRHPEPMLPLSFFRRGAFGAANGSYALLYAALSGALFYVSIFFQNVRGYSALETGISWITMNVPFLVVAAYAGRIQARFGARLVVLVGTFTSALGVLACALFGVDSGYWTAVPAYLLLGFGYGLCVPALSTVAMGAVEVEHAGVASGLLNTSRQVGSAVGLALLGSITAAAAASAWSDRVDELPASEQAAAAGVVNDVVGGRGAAVAAQLGPSAARPAYESFVSGMRWAMIAGGCLVLGSTVLTWYGTRRLRRA